MESDGSLNFNSNHWEKFIYIITLWTTQLVQSVVSIATGHSARRKEV